MPFIPHTKKDVEEMLQTIGVKKIDDLFDEIPETLKHASLEGIPVGMSEMALTRLMRERAAQDANMLCFIGAGAYEHHIPAAVWEVATRGEFYTSYTPYQAEASQGSLQLIYEYQTMMASLMALDVSNASLYDGGSGLAEAILMAARLSRKKNKIRILVPQSIHPNYRNASKAIVYQQDIELVDVPYVASTGRVDMQALDKLLSEEVAALVIAQPNFFGVLEDVDQLTNWAQKNNILTIGVVNPMAMALLKPPGEWGEKGVDIACGEGQPLGVPLASGGPYYGFLCCKQEHVRQMPGRIVGRTTDKDGKQGFVLTLQAREQHIRRAKATSNICTNQGLLVTASTIYMSMMGPVGLRHIAELSHQNSRVLKETLAAIDGVEVVFDAPFFHEVVIRVNKSANNLLHKLATRNIQAGFALEDNYPELKNCLLICATETKSTKDIELLAKNISEVLAEKETCQI
jgi:glycine dehydrogenase subunit 1